MSKHAIIISGQPRFLERCYPQIYDNLLRPNGMPDVFAHLWWSEDETTTPYKYGGNGGWQHQRITTNAPEVFAKLYSPKKLKVEPSKKWTASHIDYAPSVRFFQPGALSEPEEPISRMFNNSVSMWKSIFEANLLRKEYEWENDIRYDGIIRTRSDLEINRPINISTLDLSKYHYANLSQPTSCVSDWINISNSEGIDIGSRIYYDYETLVKKHFDNGTIPFGNEVLLKTQLLKHGVTPQINNWSVCLPRF